MASQSEEVEEEVVEEEVLEEEPDKAKAKVKRRAPRGVERKRRPVRRTQTPGGADDYLKRTPSERIGNKNKAAADANEKASS